MATAFVMWRDRLLLHRHPKLEMWLPCGGHIEPGETPQEAAVREVLEEAGIEVELLGDTALQVAEPVQLIRPRGVQLEPIGPGHEHIDFIFYARPREPYEGRLTGTEPGMGWYSAEQVAGLELTDELKAWTRLAFEEMASVPG